MTRGEATEFPRRRRAHRITISAGTWRSGLIAWDMRPNSWVERACEPAGRELTRAEWARYLLEQPCRRTCAGR